VIALLIAMICSIGVYLFVSIKIYDSYLITTIVLFAGLLVYVTPLILIIISRKNYFEMIRQRELEKKAVESGQSPSKNV
jgi:amino acid transporter